VSCFDRDSHHQPHINGAYSARCLVVGTTTGTPTHSHVVKGLINMTTTVPTAVGQDIVLFAKVGSQRFTLTATQLRDTVAAY
jgi:hypothetical protein